MDDPLFFLPHFLLTLASLNPLAPLMALMFRNISVAVFGRSRRFSHSTSDEKHHLLVLGPSADRLVDKLFKASVTSHAGKMSKIGMRFCRWEQSTESFHKGRNGQVETCVMSHWGA